MNLEFGTKAETLQALKSGLKSAEVLPSDHFGVSEWKQNPRTILDRVAAHPWGGDALAVRSSAASEDAAHQSGAGQFTTVLHVSGETAIIAAINEVIQSYPSENELDQILIQPMVKDVAMSGVAFGVEPSSGGNYYVINYDDSTGTTESVTSGSGLEQKICYHSRFAPNSLPPPLDRVILMMAELESIFSTTHLDVEFAIRKTGEVVLLQVRRLVNVQGTSLSEEQQVFELQNISKRITQLSRPHPYLYGRKGIFGIMPDWNPAEIIGVRPRPLSLSLYRELVTDSIWAYQRNNYGYKNLRSFPLLISLGGLPYIDVRVSFNSFVPKDVDDELAEKLVNHYLDKLAAFPASHDKVEFDIVYTAYTFDSPDRINELSAHGFSDKECGALIESLRRLTSRIIHPESGLWQSDAKRVSELDKRLDVIMRSDLDHVQRIYWLLEDCKRYGTLPFAGLARAGFIASLMLRSLVNVGVLSAADHASFMATLDSISTGMRHDFHTLQKAAFLAKYGHLRPGTYDILSPRYDEEPDRYFDWNQKTEPVKKEPELKLSLLQLKQIDKLLSQHKLHFDVLGLFEFMKTAMEGREYAKFVFTRSLSEAMFLFGEMCRGYGFSLDDCSYATIDTVREIYLSSLDPKACLKENIEQGRDRFEVTKQITMPALIVEESDIWSFTHPVSEPNYVTQKTAIGRSSTVDDSPEKLRGTILFIPNADPGYDWIFSCHIAGFVTKYGGVNSHMAIRAGELEIPAVIGAGDVLYDEWSKANLLQLDCVNRQVQVIR
jgi:glutamine kinase